MSESVALDYANLAARFGASVPIESLESIAARLSSPGAPAGTTDAYLAEGRSERTTARAATR